MAGKDPLDHKIWRIAWPAILSNTLLELVEAGIFGHLDKSYASIRLASALLVYFPVWYLSQPWGNHGLWLSFTLFKAARGLTLAVCYRRLSRRDGWFRNG